MSASRPSQLDLLGRSKRATSTGTEPASADPTASAGEGANLHGQSSTAQQAADTYARHLKQDSGLTPQGRAMAEAVSAPGHSTVYTQVSTFAVNGVQANDMLIVRRIPHTPDGSAGESLAGEPGAAQDGGPGIVLYMPQREGPAFHEFKDEQAMHAWLREQASDPDGLERLASHFARENDPGRTAYVKKAMGDYVTGDPNAVVGAYGREPNDIFERLDRGTRREPPVNVPGLHDVIKLSDGHGDENGYATETYKGQTPDGETVLFQYDAYGNLLGVGKREGEPKKYYFQRDGLNQSMPLKALATDPKKARDTIANEVSSRIGGDDWHGFYNALTQQLESPFHGTGDLLGQLGVPKSAADATEKYLNNPVGRLLVDINGKDNRLGRLLGVDKDDMDQRLMHFGDLAQASVPYYGQARVLGGLLAKALKNEPMSVDEQEDLIRMTSLTKPNVAQKSDITPFSRPASEPGSPAAQKTEGSAPQEGTPTNRTPTGSWNSAFFADDVALKQWKPDEQGVYHVDGKHYIDLEGRPARINGTRDNAQPNFIDEQGQTVNSNVPNVRYKGDGTWEINRLRGGIREPAQENNSGSQTRQQAQANLQVTKEAYSQADIAREHIADEVRATRDAWKGANRARNDYLRARANKENDPHEYARASAAYDPATYQNALQAYESATNRFQAATKRLVQTENAYAQAKAHLENLNAS